MGTSIHSLPTEMIQAIFVLACAPCVITIPPDFTAAPWKLTRICSRWRTIAIDTAEIWSTIEFTFKGPFDVTPIIDFGLKLLDRTKDHPLTINNHGNLMEFAIHAHSTRYVKRFLLPVITRIRSLTYTGGAEALEPFLTAPAGSLALLEDLHLKATMADDGPFWKRNATVFTDAKRLRTTAFLGRFDLVNPEALHLPWEQLDELKFHCCHVDPKSFKDAFMRMTNLTLLCISLANPDVLRDTVCLPNLSTFEVKLGWEIPLDRLGHFHFPNLQRLYIQADIAHGEASWNTFANQSCTKLESLTLHSTSHGRDSSDIISIIFSSPCAQKWSLKHCYLFPLYLYPGALDVVAASSVSALNLFVCKLSKEEDYGAFARCLRRLCRVSPAMERAIVVPLNGMGSAEWGIIQTLQSAGLPVSVSIEPVRTFWMVNEPFPWAEMVQLKHQVTHDDLLMPKGGLVEDENLVAQAFLEG